MAFEDAVNHRMNVVEISVTAKAQGRTPLLGVLYDELARCVLPLSLHLHICFVWQATLGGHVIKAWTGLQHCRGDGEVV